MKGGRGIIDETSSCEIVHGKPSHMNLRRCDAAYVGGASKESNGKLTEGEVKQSKVILFAGSRV